MKFPCGTQGSCLAFNSIPPEPGGCWRKLLMYRQRGAGQKVGPLENSAEQNGIFPWSNQNVILNRVIEKLEK